RRKQPRTFFLINKYKAKVLSSTTLGTFTCYSTDGLRRGARVAVIEQAFLSCCQLAGRRFESYPLRHGMNRGNSGSTHALKHRRLHDPVRLGYLKFVNRRSHVGPPELTWSLGLLLSAGVE